MLHLFNSDNLNKRDMVCATYLDMLVTHSSVIIIYNPPDNYIHVMLLCT